MQFTLVRGALCCWFRLSDVHHAALLDGAELEGRSDEALEQRVGAVGPALELRVELGTQMEVATGQPPQSPPSGRRGWCRK